MNLLSSAVTRVLRSGLRRATTLLGVVVAGLFLAGCASGSGGKSKAVPHDHPPLSEANQEYARGSLAAVLILGQPRVTVVETIESVFTGAGLKKEKGSRDLLVFERNATRTESAAYGSWSGEESHVRLKVEIIQQGSNQFFLCCRSFIARAAGTPVEDEQALARRKVRQYEHLLDEVAARLN